MLRFDGLYVSPSRELHDGSFCRTYMRFYPDGCVIEQAVQQPATVEQIMHWFKRSMTGISIGEYTIDTEHIKLFTVLEYGSDHPGEPPHPPVREDYEGDILNNRLILSKIKRSGSKTDKCIYDFSSS